MNPYGRTLLLLMVVLYGCQSPSVSSRFESVYSAFNTLNAIMVGIDGTLEEALASDGSRQALSALDSERELAESFAKQSINYEDNSAFVCLEWSRKHAPHLYDTFDHSKVIRVYMTRLKQWGSDSWLWPKTDGSGFVVGSNGQRLIELLAGDSKEVIKWLSWDCSDGERSFENYIASSDLQFRTRDMLAAFVLILRGESGATLLGDKSSRDKVIQRLRDERAALLESEAK